MTLKTSLRHFASNLSGIQKPTHLLATLTGLSVPKAQLTDVQYLTKEVELIRQPEFLDKPKNRPLDLPPSKLHQHQNYSGRLKSRKDNICSVQGCCNLVLLFSNVCRGHYRNYLNYGSYFVNNPVTFKQNINPMVNELMKDGYDSEGLQVLMDAIDNFYADLYNHPIKILDGATRNTPAASKDKQIKWIREARSKSHSTYKLALRLAVVVHHFKLGKVDGGAPLRFLMYRGLCACEPATPTLPIKEAIGQTILSNFLSIAYRVNLSSD